MTRVLITSLLVGAGFAAGTAVGAAAAKYLGIGKKKDEEEPRAAGS